MVVVVVCGGVVVVVVVVAGHRRAAVIVAAIIVVDAPYPTGPLAPVRALRYPLSRNPTDVLPMRDLQRWLRCMLAALV